MHGFQRDRLAQWLARATPRFATHLPQLCMLVLALVSTASAEWNENVLYTFQGGSDGPTPAGVVVFDAAGKLIETSLLSN
jgi:hypothetical protein